jgi:hypothetical protein
MDPFELLKQDHETVSKLFDRIEAASGKAKIGIFQQIKSELDLHAHIEETIFYPAIEHANETRALTLEAYEEHKVVKELLSELDAGKSASDEWKAKLTVLKENVEHHVEEEENELFDKANDVLTGEEAEKLGDRMLAEKVKGGGRSSEATENRGLLQKIANTLGLGTSPQKPTQTIAGNKGTRANAGKKQATRAKAAKKTGGAVSKSKRPKSTKSSTGATKKKGPSKKKGTASKKATGRAVKKAAGKKKAKR